MFGYTMIKKRKVERIPIMTVCKLVTGETELNCLVDNISETGASVKITDSDFGRIRLGDTVNLDVLLLAPVNYLCTIVRLELDHVGLQFINSN